ncbi:MAG: baseplate assembly protein [Delftia acidovorans]|nr:MAG: baseplate assembly protein [Delftia acidovorans]
MSRFSATTLDLSRFPPPLAIRNLDYEDVLRSRISRLQTLFEEADIAFDVEKLEATPAAVLQETDAYRELLAYAAVNDAVKAGLIAFAVGTDLDHLGLTAALGLPSGQRDSMLRRVISPATANVAAILESDAEYRRRLLLAPEAYATAGTAGGYLFHALWADPRVLNADVWCPSPGNVVVAVQSRANDGTAPSDLIQAVRSHLTRSDIKPLTDVVTVRSVTNVAYSVSVDAYILAGPDQNAVEDAIRLSVAKTAASRRTPARDMPRSAIIAAAQLDVVDKVILASPMTDIASGYGEVPVIDSIEVRVHTYDG